MSPKLEREVPDTMGKKRTAASSSAVVSAAGSKLPIAAQRSAAVASDLQRDWTTSTITKRDQKKLRSLGLISTDEKDVRFPGSESRPNPPARFTFMFPAFLFRGLSLPATNSFDASYSPTAFCSSS
jgi:hypothetical protein